MIIRYGGRGNNVYALQYILRFLGYDFIDIDGIFGPKTSKAVVDWQLSNLLEPDGIVGPNTIKSFYKNDKLLNAMVMVESEDNDNVIGDKTLKNKAYGCLQIRQGVVDNVNSKFKLSLKAEDCLGNRMISIFIWYAYWTIYTERNDEDKAKTWNGGPAWRKYYGVKGKENYTKNLDLYWSKVKKLLV